MKKHQTACKWLTLSTCIFSLSLVTPAFAESTGRYIDDATITAKVKEVILADSHLKVLQVHVDTNHGIVTLSGNVDTKAQDEEATSVTKKVEGVVSVTDVLTVNN